MPLPSNTLLFASVGSIRHLEAEALLSDLPSESVDLVLTSPPYDGIRDYHGTGSLDLGAVGSAVARVLKPGGVAVLVMQDQTRSGRKSLTSFRTILDWVDRGALGLWECAVYQRDGVPGGYWAKRFRVDHEYVPIFVKGEQPAYFDKSHLMVPCSSAGRRATGTRRLPDGTVELIKTYVVSETKCRGTVWPYRSSSREALPRDEKRLKLRHPATFPDALAEDVVRCFCRPGGVVVDPFCGSGTTLLAAAKHGREFIGGDLSLEYCLAAAERLALNGFDTRVS